MNVLWESFAGLLLLAMLIIFLPLIFARKKLQQSDPQQQNIAVFQERLTELELEKNQGTLDDTAFLQLKLELEKNLLVDVEGTTAAIFAPTVITPIHWLFALLMTSAVGITSLTLYAQLGRSEDYKQSLVLQAKKAQQAQAAKKTEEKFQQIVAILKEKLVKNPQDIEKWLLLANTYATLGHYHEAAETYLAMMPYLEKNKLQYASAKGAYAQMLFQEAGEQITPAVGIAIQETLKLDPLEPSALILSGIDGYNHGDITLAIAYWKKAKTKADENLIATFIDPIITQAQAQLPQLSKAKIKVKLSLAAALKNQVKPEQTVFIFARAAGEKMPLAVQRIQVKDLPATVILDDSMAAMPTKVLSSVATVNITARISLSGSVQENKGDLFATVEQVEVNPKGEIVELVIDKAVN